MGPSKLIFLIQAALIICLIYLAYVDWRSFRLPDLITLPLIASGIGFNCFSELRFTDPQSAVLGACLGYSFLWALNLAYRIFRGQSGIGMGDAKLLAGLGAWLGWASLPGILLVASVTGLIGGVLWLKWQNQSHQHAFPFGPFLAIAGIITLLWPQLIFPIMTVNSI